METPLVTVHFVYNLMESLEISCSCFHLILWLRLSSCLKVKVRPSWHRGKSLIDLPKQGVLADVSPHPQALFRFSYEELKGSRRGAVISQGMNQAPGRQDRTHLTPLREGPGFCHLISEPCFSTNHHKLSTQVKAAATSLLNIPESGLCSRSAMF